jgi:phage protein D
MADTQYQIWLDGNAVNDDLYGDVVELTVEENTETLGELRLRLQMTQDDDGNWNYLDDVRLAPFKTVKVKIGFSGGGGLAAALGSLLGGGGGDDGMAPVFDGYITSVALAVGTDPDDGYLDVIAYDTGVLMGLEEKVVSWPNVADSDIVTQILGVYQVPITADKTTPPHQEAVTTILQRGTDLQFVRGLARKNGLEFYFETDKSAGVTAYFRAPQLDAAPQPDLAVRFGDDGNLIRFEARVDALRPLHVKAEQVDVKSATINSVELGGTQLHTLGANTLSDLVSGPINSLVTPLASAAQMFVSSPPTADSTELQTIAQAVSDEAAWMITASGEVDTDAYQTVLRPHRLVLVKGVGSLYSGKYYVTRVVHELKSDGSYAQKFEARRNARGLDGSEKFGSGGLAIAIPGI